MKLVVANLKMNFSLTDAITFQEHLKKLPAAEYKLIVCPESPLLAMFRHSNYLLGSQDISLYDHGVTGEVSPTLLKDLGVEYVLINHHERHETVSDVITKLRQALCHQLKPILCIGEAQVGDDFNLELLKLKEILSTVKENLHDLIIAYEPGFNIGGDEIHEIEDIKDHLDALRNYLREEYPYSIPLLYGGSITDQNIELLEAISLDGYLIGKLCTKWEQFSNLLTKIN